MADLAEVSTAPGAEAVSGFVKVPVKRRRRHRADSEALWGVVTLPDGSKQAFTRVTAAIEAALAAEVSTVELCVIAPKTRGMKVVQTITV